MSEMSEKQKEEMRRAAGSFNGEAQHFSDIEKVFAKDGFVFIKVKKRENDPAFGRKLTDKMFSIREAAGRARALNNMAHLFPEKDRKVAMDIVEATIAACKEAQAQAEKIIDKKSKPLITDAQGNPIVELPEDNR